ncbi:MAG: hypothetical protein PHT07_09050 [Paludibacter sp.]|nr:hypothetical protein [Paludibacter sp.]
MNKELESIILSIILITVGILLKKDLIPNTRNIGKMWLVPVVVGSMGVLVSVLALLIRN